MDIRCTSLFRTVTLHSRFLVPSFRNGSSPAYPTHEIASDVQGAWLQSPLSQLSNILMAKDSTLPLDTVSTETSAETYEPPDIVRAAEKAKPDPPITAEIVVPRSEDDVVLPQIVTSVTNPAPVTNSGPTPSAEPVLIDGVVQWDWPPFLCTKRGNYQVNLLGVTWLEEQLVNYYVLDATQGVSLEEYETGLAN
ncbi:hypothetical protein M422DRAFT_54399 [Sphaerobolus stellatus SS14]|uniref:Uncharacterized protein n=1 Tax=Sphaerobolus stellatus (strain SS14) TaxID=990650 RepID=A0A0C9UV02_SPHS4|nr:hypothetical protein M422DRAFT_54399 [Sphaerobolus stellatus SS14]